MNNVFNMHAGFKNKFSSLGFKSGTFPSPAQCNILQILGGQSPGMAKYCCLPLDSRGTKIHKNQKKRFKGLSDGIDLAESGINY
jgi:hypothetical protein